MGKGKRSQMTGYQRLPLPTGRAAASMGFGKRGTTNQMSDRANAAAKERTDQLTDMRAVNQQLQATIDELRIRLEAGRHEAAAEVSRARAAMADEILQLKAAVQSMRDRLDAQMAEGDTAIQTVRASNSGEMKQFVTTINQLRSELEAQKASGEQALGDMAGDFARERGTLQNQVQAIRLELEKRP